MMMKRLNTHKCEPILHLNVYLGPQDQMGLKICSRNYTLLAYGIVLSAYALLTQ